MSEHTHIAWCDSTVNPWSGCTMVLDENGGLKNSGCLNCYAKARDDRHMIENISHWGTGAPRLWHTGFLKNAMALNRKPWVCDLCGEAYQTNSELCRKTMSNPHSVPWKCNGQLHRRRVFSLSLGDWLDDMVRIEWFKTFLDTVRQCDQVIWILCSKRIELLLSRIQKLIKYLRQFDGGRLDIPLIDWLELWNYGKPPHNVWLLASVESQAMANKRVPELLRIPAVCRGLSLEPLLGPVDLTDICVKEQHGEWHFNALTGAWASRARFKLNTFTPGSPRKSMEDDNPIDDPDFHGAKLDWLIIGGESGKKARPCDLDWIRSIVADGKRYDVATFVKQLGSNPVDDTRTCTSDFAAKMHLPTPLKLNHDKGGDTSEWPVAMRIQQWPNLNKV